MTLADLTTDAFAWNAIAGGLHGLLLDRQRPAIGLFSYKFSLTPALWFEIETDDGPMDAGPAQIEWQPHLVTGRYAFGDVTLSLEALFLAPERLAVRYRLEGTPPGKNPRLVIRGMARNGRDTGGFFEYRGEVSVHDGMGLVRQQVEIPDYRHTPVGERRRYAHHLAWMVEAPGVPEVSAEAVRVEAPFDAAGENISPVWSVQQALSPATEASYDGTLHLAVRWLGPVPPDRCDLRDMASTLRVARRAPFEAGVEAMRGVYETLLARLPEVKGRYREREEYRRLYAQAWVCIWQNIAGPLATARKTVPGPSAWVSKVAHNGFGPAQWETSLAGYLVSFVDPDLGIQILESVLACVEDDGFLPEDLVFNRDVKLASLEPTMMREIAERAGRTDFLATNYERLYRQLLFHIKHPGFQYLTRGDSHLAIENYYSLRDLEWIARRLGKPPAHLADLRCLRQDLEAFLDDALKREIDTRPVFEFLDGYLDEAAAQPIVNRIRKHHLSADGRYFMYRHPDGTDSRTGQENLDAYKMVLLLHFVLGLERLGEEALLDKLAERTFQGFQVAGDFWECYYVTGEPWGNGPMSIFGAFGWIWLLMAKPVGNGIVPAPA